jgi:hypothetical protein
MKLSREVMPLKVTVMPYFQSHIFNHSKMVDVQTSEMDGKREAVDMGL